MKKLDEKMLEQLHAVKKGLETNTSFTLEEKEDYGEELLHIYRLQEKEYSELYVPIEIYFNFLDKTISLRFELFLGLNEVGRNKTIKGMAEWLRDYADYIEVREQEILDRGYYLDTTVIDGINHIYFFYRKDFSLNQVKEVVEEAKKLIEKVWVIGVVWT
ncbi:MAG: hypothetical protein ACETWM_08095 [Candidatus Lokiarchaeia archaeon]